MKHLLLRTAAAAASLLLLLPAEAQESAVKRIMELAREDNRTMRHLDILCNRFGGRPVGSAAYDDAAEWAASEFRKWGYEVTLEEAGEMPVGFNRGPWFGRMLGDESMTLHFATPSYSVGTHGAERGRVVIEPRSREAFERMKGALKGAWVLLEYGSNGWGLDASPEADRQRAAAIASDDSLRQEHARIRRETPRGQTPELPELSRVPALLYREMIAAGVRGFIHRSRVPITALYCRSVVRAKTMTFDDLPAVPDILLDEAQFDVIRRMTEERRHFELEFDIRNHFKMGPVKYHNVVAVKRGTKHPDQYVLVSGHLDAYDVATGGVDCGTGVSVAMEAARMLAEAGAKPERTIVFCLFAGEEFGLLGAKAWVERHADKLGGISNIFNRDGGPLAAVGVRVPASLAGEYEKICRPIRELWPDYGFEVEQLTPRPVPTSTGGTDATVFATKGVPAVSLRERDVKGYDFSYREIWHTERDLYTKSIPEYQEQAAVATAIIALGTANLKEQWPREEVYTAPEQDTK